ncbi:hypothetical protein VCV18_010968 [Metarhizium anisopliae]
MAGRCKDGRNMTACASVNMMPQFKGLPLEIRELVWEATLPPGRLFHVRDSITTYPERGPPCVKRFTFHMSHRHPVATRVCRESRATALRRGFLLSKRPEAWFNPDRDMLYIDRNQRRFIQRQSGDPVYQVEGLEQVQHVGVEWRAWFRDIAVFQSEASMHETWKHALRSLRLYLPNLQTINFVLPQTRHCGGMSFGREPYGASENPCQLITLPGHVKVPWGQTSPSGATLDPAVGAVAFGRELTMRLMTWATIRDQMVRALQDDRDDAAREEKLDELVHVLPAPARNIPQVVGLWLIRTGHVGDEKLLQGFEVRTFRS